MGEREDEVYLVGYAHIDLSWLWPRSETIHEICPRTFSSVLNLMETYPDLCFSFGSAQAYSWMERYYPEIFRRIERFVKEGRWEVVGGSWVEHNANIISGESLVRQYLMGKRYFMEKFGVDVKVAWLPDCFGFCWTMPQILKKCGIDYFMTAKLNWQIERMKPPIPFPHHVFWWQSPDGSRVLAYQTVGGYNDRVVKERILAQLEKLKKLHKIGRLMVVFGHGDHGGGPTKDMVERALMMKKDPSFPKVRFSRAEEYFEELKTLSRDVKFPVVNDELYLKTHRGTFTTEAFVKKANRRCEVLLLNAEKFSTLARRFGFRYPQAELVECWKKLLFGQVHDQIDGTSIDDVYRDAATDYADITHTAQRILNSALKTISSHISTVGGGEYALVVFNPLAWNRDGIVKVSLSSIDVTNPCVLDLKSEPVPCQLIEEYGEQMLIFLAEDVPALGYKLYYIAPAGGERGFETDIAVRECENILENRFFRVRIDPETGCVASLFDKRNDREVFDGSRGGNLLEIYEDEPPTAWGEPAWNIYLGRRFEPELVSVEVVEKGPVRGRVRITKVFGRSKFTQDVILYMNTPRVDFELRIDWHEHHKFAKVSFPFNLSTHYATYEIPYGAIQRFDHSLDDPACEISMPPRRWEKSDRAKFEVPALQWVDVTDKTGEYGVSLFNDSKHGFSFEANTLRMSLVRGQRRGYPFHVYTLRLLPDSWSDQSDNPIVGEHLVRYAIYPHKGDWKSASTVRKAYEFNYPLLTVVEPHHEGELPPSYSFIRVSPENIVLTVVKKAEDSEETVIRLYEVHDEDAKAEIYFDKAPSEVYETDLMEWSKYIKEKVPVSGNYVRVPVSHSEIKTLIVKF